MASGAYPSYEESSSFHPEDDESDSEKQETETRDEPPRKAVRFPWRRVVDRSFADALREYPGVENQTDFRLLATVVLSFRRDSPDRNIVLPYQRIAECMGVWDKNRLRDDEKGHSSTGTVLDSFLDRVLPGVSYNEHSYFLSKARELTGVGGALSNEIIDHRDSAFTREGDDKVSLMFDAEAAEKDRRRERKIAAQKAQRRWIEDALVEPQKRLLQYLIQVGMDKKSQRFTPDKEDVDRAFRKATSWTKPGRRFNALDQLMAIQNDPVPRYKPSYSGDTVRVFTAGHSLCTINKELRRILHPDWIELDLKSAQLAIVAEDWGVDRVKTFLRDSEKDIWRDLYDFMEWGSYGTGISFEHAKPALKKGLYATVFGAGRRVITVEIIHGYIDTSGRPDFLLTGEFVDRFLDHPLVKELLRARSEQLEEIKSEGGAQVFGEEIDCKKPRDAPSVLAQLAQARELKLLLPALGVAEEQMAKTKTRVWIPLWQHDGFSIKVSSSKQKRREREVRRFKEAVNGETGPYQTELEVDYPEEEFGP